jgi:hypothetical protein
VRGRQGQLPLDTCGFLTGARRTNRVDALVESPCWCANHRVAVVDDASDAIAGLNPRPKPFFFDDVIGSLVAVGSKEKLVVRDGLGGQPLHRQVPSLPLPARRWR